MTVKTSAAILVSGICFAGAANASLDQSSFFDYASSEYFSSMAPVGVMNPAVYGGNYHAAQAQTFIPSISGVLDAVGIMSDGLDNPRAPLLLTIAETKSGMPPAWLSGGIASAQVTDSYYGISYTGVAFGSVRKIDFSQAGVFLEAGKTYALILSSEAVLPTSGQFVGYGSPYQWWGARRANGYAFGQAYFSVTSNSNEPFTWAASASDQDNFFQTFMVTSSVAEPEIYAMLLSGLGLIGAVAGRRKQ